jgi:predicted Rdx family selenoprotein
MPDFNEPRDYVCLECNWCGTAQALQFEVVETCMGQDKIEICPQCGGFEIRIKNDDNKKRNNI